MCGSTTLTGEIITLPTTTTTTTTTTNQYYYHYFHYHDHHYYHYHYHYHYYYYLLLGLSCPRVLWDAHQERGLGPDGEKGGRCELPS